MNTSRLQVNADTSPEGSGEPYYVPQGNEIEIFAGCHARGLPVLLKGPTGCGKTRFVEHMAWRLGRPLVTVPCHDDLSASDLTGRYSGWPASVRACRGVCHTHSGTMLPAPLPVPRLPVSRQGRTQAVTTQPGGEMDKRQLEALVKKNAAKAASATSTRKGFGKKYDVNLADDPIDEASLKERERAEHFFKEMRKREF